jgi:hypothetical protein
MSRLGSNSLSALCAVVVMSSKSSLPATKLLVPAFLILVGASSPSGNDANAPFLVMSEITVKDDGDGGDGHALANDLIKNYDRDDAVAYGDGSYDGNTKNVDNGGEAPPVSDRINDHAIDGERELRMRDDKCFDAIAGGGGGKEVGGYFGGSDTSDENDKRQEVEDDYYPAPGGGEVTDGGTTTSSSSSSSALWSPLTSINASLHKKITSSDTTAASFQPLRTLKRLQAMLDETDYATHSVASSSSPLSSSSMITPKSSTIKAGVVTKNNDDNDDEKEKRDVAAASTGATSSSAADNDLTSPPQPEKLWTSKDRAKYRRTQRTEKQRQQDENARKLRDMERQRIILEERERKKEFLLSLKKKGEEVQSKQQQVYHFDETTDLTNDETDDGYGYYGGVGGGGCGMGFELPNLPVYLSDGETEEEEDDEDDSESNLHPPAGSSSTRNNYQDPQQQHQKQKGYHQAMQIEILSVCVCIIEKVTRLKFTYYNLYLPKSYIALNMRRYRTTDLVIPKMKLTMNVVRNRLNHYLKH